MNHLSDLEQSAQSSRVPLKVGDHVPFRGVIAPQLLRQFEQRALLLDQLAKGDDPQIKQEFEFDISPKINNLGETDNVLPMKTPGSLGNSSPLQPPIAPLTVGLNEALTRLRGLLENMENCVVDIEYKALQLKANEAPEEIQAVRAGVVKIYTELGDLLGRGCSEAVQSDTKVFVKRLVESGNMTFSTKKGINAADVVNWIEAKIDPNLDEDMRAHTKSLEVYGWLNPRGGKQAPLYTSLARHPRRSK